MIKISPQYTLEMICNLRSAGYGYNESNLWMLVSLSGMNVRCVL